VLIGRVKEVSTQGVGWASEEAFDLVAPLLNLVLYMHLRIFAYTSNVLIASFEYMELILDSGTPKNFMLLWKSCLSTDRVSVMKLTWSTFQLCGTKVENGQQMRGMVSGLGSVRGCPRPPRDNVGEVCMDTSTCR
jgi:hypothetical protein